MAVGHKTGGRRKGTANKDKTQLLELVRKAVGDKDYHPVVQMALLATSDDKEIPRELKFQATKEVAQYVAPKLKAIEHGLTDDAAAAIFNMNYFPDSEEEQDERVQH
jgi:hypothetical protein